jgi:hypothetical protein
VILVISACSGSSNEIEWQPGFVHFWQAPQVFNADGENILRKEIYVITSKTQMNKMYVEFFVDGNLVEVPFVNVAGIQLDAPGGYDARFFSSNVLILVPFSRSSGFPARAVSFEDVIFEDNKLYFCFKRDWSYATAQNNRGYILFSVELSREVWERYEFGGNRLI